MPNSHDRPPGSRKAAGAAPTSSPLTTPAGTSGAPVELETGELEQLRAGLVMMALRALRETEAAEEAAQETLARAVQALREGRLEDREKHGA